MEAIIQRLDRNKITLAIGVIWLFQVSAIIGMTLGFNDWFLSKTPLNLIIISGALFLFFPVSNSKTTLLAFLFFLIGMTVEALGVRFDWIFGPYFYGENLGPKVLGVPLLIGVNWMMLTFITAGIASQVSSSTIAKILIGSALMVFLDLFIEQSAYGFDFWYFEGDHVPIRNYVAWFMIGSLLHWLFHKLSVKGNAVLSSHIYLSQLTFFGYFFILDKLL